MDQYLGYPTAARPDPDYWLGQLNARAKALGLEQAVKMVQPAPGVVQAIRWVYEAADGQELDLGYDVEAAALALDTLAEAQAGRV